VVQGDTLPAAMRMVFHQIGTLHQPWRLGCIACLCIPSRTPDSPAQFVGRPEEVATAWTKHRRIGVDALVRTTSNSQRRNKRRERRTERLDEVSLNPPGLILPKHGKMRKMRAQTPRGCGCRFECRKTTRRRRAETFCDPGSGPVGSSRLACVPESLQGGGLFGAVRRLPLAVRRGKQF